MEISDLIYRGKVRASGVFLTDCLGPSFVQAASELTFRVYERLVVFSPVFRNYTFDTRRVIILAQAYLEVTNRDLITL